MGRVYSSADVTWDWKHIPHLFPGTADYPGINVQMACNLGAAIAAFGPIPVPGARHDAFAYGASGLKDMLAGLHTQADLGYVGVDGIDLIPVKRRPGQAEIDPLTSRSTSASPPSGPRSSAPWHT